MPITVPDWLPGGGTVIGPPDAQTKPTDTSQRDELVKTLAAQHKGQVGGPSQVLTKDAQGNDQHYYDKYSFGDGTTIEIAPTGQVQNYVPKTEPKDVTPGFTDITQVRNADQSITYYGRDPADGQMKPVVGLPTSAAPSSAKQPSPTAQLDKIDAQGNVIAPGDTTTRPISLRDPATGTTTDIPKDPAGSVTAVGDNFYVIKPDGSSTLVTDAAGKPVAKTKDASQFNVPGIGLVNYDPSTGKASTLIAAPTGIQAKDLKPEVRGGKTFVPVDNGSGGIDWQETNLPTDTQYTVAQNDPRSPNVLLIDQQGNSKLVSKGPDWKPPPSPGAGNAITPDTTSPFVVSIGDNGQPQFTPNQNRLSITDAQQQLIQQLGGKVADGSMSEDEAKNLIASMTSAMTAEATKQNAAANLITAQTGQQRLGLDVAQQTLAGVQQGAQTGAGLLQNRVTAATGALNNILGNAFGNANMMQAIPNLGGRLTNGLSEWVTQLGGGQPVYDSAAAMVNQANPTISQNPTIASQAYQALRGMMDLYKQQTGQDYTSPDQQNFTSPTTTGTGTGTATLTDGTPLSQTNVTPNPALAAANQTNTSGFNPQAPTTALNQAGYADTPMGRAAAAQSNPTLAPTVRPPGTFTPTWQQSYPSAVGQPATGPVVGQIAPLPMPTPYYPQPFQAPNTVAA